MTEQLSLSDFSVHLNEEFDIKLDSGERYTIELISATELGSEPLEEGQRRSFSLIFRHPRKDVYLQQRIYTLEHEEMGQVDIFLVPLGPDEEGMRYEAVFN